MKADHLESCAVLAFGDTTSLVVFRKSAILEHLDKIFFSEFMSSKLHLLGKATKGVSWHRLLPMKSSVNVTSLSTFVTH